MAAIVYSAPDYLVASAMGLPLSVMYFLPTLVGLMPDTLR
jgi:hypothetical protein